MLVDWLASLGGAFLEWVSGGGVYWVILTIGFLFGLVIFSIGLVVEAVNKDTRFMSSRSVSLNNLREHHHE